MLLNRPTIFKILQNCLFVVLIALSNVSIAQVKPDPKDLKNAGNLTPPANRSEERRVGKECA